MSAADKTKLDGITASADSVSFSRSLSNGTKIGSININGTSTDMYAPSSGISKTDLLTYIYPVGSIYMSVNNVSPASFLGGT